MMTQRRNPLHLHRLLLLLHHLLHHPLLSPSMFPPSLPLKQWGVSVLIFCMIAFYTLTTKEFLTQYENLTRVTSFSLCQAHWISWEAEVVPGTLTETVSLTKVKRRDCWILWHFLSGFSKDQKTNKKNFSFDLIYQIRSDALFLVNMWHSEYVPHSKVGSCS